MMWKGNTEDRGKYTHGDTEMDQIVDPFLGGKASAHLHQGLKSGRRLRTSSTFTHKVMSLSLKNYVERKY
jgi:hypothetical protein